jgi:hypothetical protein
MKQLSKLLLILFLTTSSKTFAFDFTVHVHGRILFLDAHDQTVKPLAGVKVEAWDSDIDGQIHFPSIDDFMGSSFTDANGDYAFDASGGDGGDWSWSRPDVYVKVVFVNQDGKLRLTDEFNNTQYYVSDMHNHDNSEGDVSIGPLIVTGAEIVQADRGNKVQVWNGATIAYNEFVNSFGPIPSGNYDVEYFGGWDTGTPWTNLNTTHWPNTYPTGGGDITSRHEFGHTIRHSLDGDDAHFFGDLVRFAYARYHDNCPETNEGFAFNEGWAEYWSHAGGRSISGSKPMENECIVNFLLSDLEKKMPGGRKDMIDVLRQNPGTIHSFDEFCAAAAKLGGIDCGKIGVSSSPLVTKAVPAITRKVIFNEFRKAMDRQGQYIVTLKKTIATAKAEADRNLTCDGKNCELIFQKAIAPAILQADAQINLLILNSWRARSKDTLFFTKKVKEGNFNQWKIANIATYRKKVKTILLQSLTAALQSASRIKGDREQLVQLTKNLKSKMTVIREMNVEPGVILPTNFSATWPGESLVPAKE